MANNYILMSAALPFPEEAARDAIDVFASLEFGSETMPPRWFLDELFKQKDEQDALKEALHSEDSFNAVLGLLESEKDIFLAETHCEWSEKEKKLFIWNEEDADVDLVARVVSMVMERHHVEGCVTFAAAFTCDKPRVDDFGGIAAACVAGEYEIMGTTAVREQLAEKLLAKQAQKTAANEEEKPAGPGL